METWGDAIVLMVMGIAILLAVAAVVLFFTFATVYFCCTFDTTKQQRRTEMKNTIVIAALLLIPAVAWAQESIQPPTPVEQSDTKCKLLARGPQTGKERWMCPTSSKPVTCSVFEPGLQFCSGPLKADQNPTNCGWRKGNYVCW